jgi:hypothetical protein
MVDQEQPPASVEPLEFAFTPYIARRLRATSAEVEQALGRLIIESYAARSGVTPSERFPRRAA